MKNIIRKMQLVLLLLSAAIVKGQLPLQFGDGIITHSPNSYTASGPTTSPAVLRVIHTSNTSTTPLGATWTSPIPKPLNNFYSNWNVITLGYVFGVTLDQNPNPNIYVSSTQIYSSTTLNNRKIWRLKGGVPGVGAIGSNSLVFDFNNPSGTGTATSLRSLGNVKYERFGPIENIYVSDWQTGEIHRLVGSSASNSLWANQPAFNPKFGRLSDDPSEMPYGLAVRRISTTSVKLYYSKISTNSNSNLIGGYGNNEIYSVDINPANGDFITGSETIANIPNINKNPTSWGGFAGSGISYVCSILPVISDIAFTKNGAKMLVGQQSWGTWGFLAPHNSEVREFINTPLFSTTWVNTANIFTAGAYLNSTCSTPAAYKNAVGGVSYSDNVIKKNAEYACDTAVYFSADYINAAGTNIVYGVQALNANGGAAGTVANSLWIDADDYLLYYDKTFLGDVEIYKNPFDCTAPCNCNNSSWTNIAMGANTSWWAGPPNALPTLTYTQGQPPLSGVLFPNYHCAGTNCIATYTFSLLKPDNTSINLPNSSGGFNLAQIPFSQMICNKTYYIIITPICGQTSCTPVRIPLIYNCSDIPPQSCECKGTVTINASQSLVVTPQNNTTNLNPVSTVTGSFTLSASLPVTEVRMLVDEFRLTTTSGNDNCMLCRNKPQTWGSINAATLSGVTSQTAVTPALANDIREFVFNNGANSMFNLNGNTLNFTLGVPGITGLNCCKLKVEVCIKFIIRDVNCCEREVLKCFTFDLQ